MEDVGDLPGPPSMDPLLAPFPMGPPAPGARVVHLELSSGVVPQAPFSRDLESQGFFDEDLKLLI